MATVSPLTTKQEIETVSNFLSKHYSEVVSDLFQFGLQCPLRISDLRAIKFSDIRDGVLYFKAKKTGKSQQIKLNSKAISIVSKRKVFGDDYLFQSHSNRASRIKAGISPARVSEALSEAGKVVGLNLGTHSMRKTWARNVYEKTNNLALVQYALQHSTSSQTLRYIGMDQDKLNEVTVSFEL